MGDSTPSTSAVVSPNQARALKNSFLWNFQFHICKDLGIEKPASDAGREAWTEFYEVFASELEEVCGVEAVSNCLDYCIKHKKKGDLKKARAILGGESPKAKAQPAPAAPTVADPTAIAAQRFASGQIDVTTFTEIVAALNAAGVGDNIPQEAAKESAEESAEEAAPTPFVPILVEDEDVDLPF